MSSAVAILFARLPGVDGSAANMCRDEKTDVETESVSVIGIAGRPASGKTTVSGLLAAAGWQSVELDRKGISGRALQRLKAIRAQGEMHLVLVSVQSLGDWNRVETLSGGSCSLIFLETPPQLRMLRALGWTERDGEFYLHDDNVGTDVDELRHHARWHVTNAGDLGELERKVGFIIAEVASTCRQ